MHITLSASDASSGVATTYYTLDGGAAQSYTGTPIAVATPKVHHLSFWSVDTAGHTEATETDTFKLDATAPHTSASLNGTLGKNGHKPARRSASR